MTNFEELARNAETNARDYERGLIVTPHTAANLWSMIAAMWRMIGDQQRQIDALAAPVAGKKGRR